MRLDIRKLSLLAILILMGVAESKAQYYLWKRTRYEIIGGIGASNFMGEVGAKEGANWFTSNVWVNPQAIRPVAQVAFRMALAPRSKVRLNLAGGLLSNDDAYGAYEARNLHFRSPIIEFGGIYEYYVIPDLAKKNRYRWLKLPRRNRYRLVTTYVFTGIMGIYTNPQAYAKGQWHSLYKYHTEGQGLPGYGKHYSRISAAIPVGLGIKFKVGKYRAINIEAGWRITATDYIDDVGVGRTPGTDDMLENFGEIGAILSYRSHGEIHSYADHGITPPRGGKWVDQYQFVMLSYTANLRSDRKGRPKMQLYN